MTSPDTTPGKSTETSPFPDLTRVSEMKGSMINETAKFNAQVSTTLQNLGKEWTEFVGMRLREDVKFFRTIHDCRSMQDVQQAYAQFWQTAFTHYSDEAKRIMQITQGAVDDTARAARELRETVTSQAQDRAA